MINEDLMWDKIHECIALQSAALASESADSPLWVDSILVKKASLLRTKNRVAILYILTERMLLLV